MDENNNNEDKKNIDEDSKKILNIVGINFSSISELENFFIPRETLLSDLKYDEIKKLIPDLKKKFSSSDMTSLQKNAEKSIVRTEQKIILSYNPSFSQRHWILTELSLRDDVQLFKTTYKDNPFLPKEQVRFIEKYRETNPRYWQTYGLGEFAINEKQIYDFEIVDEYDFDNAEFVCFSFLSP